MLFFCTLCDAARHLVMRDFAHADQTPLQPRRGVERKRPTFSCAKAEEKTRERERQRERGEGGRAHPFLGAWRAGRAGPARAGESLCEMFFRQPLKSSGYYYLTLQHSKEETNLRKDSSAECAKPWNSNAERGNVHDSVVSEGEFNTRGARDD